MAANIRSIGASKEHPGGVKRLHTEKWIDYNCSLIFKNSIIVSVIILVLNVMWSYIFETMLIFEPVYWILNYIIPLFIFYAKYFKEFYKIRIVGLHILSMFIPMVPLLIYVFHSTINDYPVIMVILTQLLHIIETLYSSGHIGALEVGKDINLFALITHISTIILYNIYYNKDKFKGLFSGICLSSIICLSILFLYDKEIVNSLWLLLSDVKYGITGEDLDRDEVEKEYKVDGEVKLTHYMWMIKIIISFLLYIYRNANII